VSVKPLLEVEDLKTYFDIKGGALSKKVGEVKAVDGVSFSVKEGEIVGIVGESGCGKSTTGKSILRLIEPTSGKVRFNGENILELSGEKVRKIRRDMQIIFQDPYASLNPRHKVGKIIGEPMLIHGIGNKAERKKRVEELLEKVGLRKEHANRYPHQFSGGQRQRIGIARALSVHPKLIICDEPVSALDVSVQSQILNLMESLKDEFKLTYVFIAHDLSVVRYISDRIAVMYLGKIVELTDRISLYENPLHPYTQALLSSVPIPDPELEKKRERIILTGEVPSPVNPPSGCRFHSRCPFVFERCKIEEPPLQKVSSEHFVACHLHE